MTPNLVISETVSSLQPTKERILAKWRASTEVFRDGELTFPMQENVGTGRGQNHHRPRLNIASA